MRLIPAAAALLALAVLAGCSARPVPQDEELCAFFRGLTERTPVDCPERFAVQRIAEIGWHQRAFKLLEGKIAGTEADLEGARKELGEVRDQILAGQRLPIRDHEERAIPYATVKPAFDGDLDAPAWRQALRFEHEYAIDSTAELRTGAQWFALWDEDYLYLAARLPDAAVHAIAYGDGKGPWQADCLEIFAMPSLALKSYWEVVVNPEGAVFHALNRNNRTGNFSSGREQPLPGLRVHTAVRDGGYVVEVGIPFASMPNYMLGNKPQAGQGMYLMMVRTDEGRMTAMRPLLYGSHNIFGYIKGTLAK